MMTIEQPQHSHPQCPWCGGPVTPPRTFCRLSCRLRYDHREHTRTPTLFPRAMTLETELPSDAELKPGRRRPRGGR